jgi:hypothetical protein
LQAISCIIKEIEAFNRKAQKIMTLDRNVNVVYTNLSRNECIQYGMHLNASGREKLSVLIGQNLKTKDPPIMLKWEESQAVLNFLHGCLICVMIVSPAVYVFDLFQQWFEHLSDD